MRILSLLILSLSFFGTCKKQEAKKEFELNPEVDFLRKFIPDSLKYLLPTLDSVLISDQQYRSGNSYTTTLKHSKTVQYIDSVNLSRIIPIIEKYGILGMKEIGGFGHYAITMTIQHSDLKTQEKYLPLFKEAFIKKKLSGSTYAMLEDRVAMKNKRLQIFGTQVMLLKNKKNELYPTIDIDNLQKRRDSIRLIDPIEDYLKQFGIKWDVEEYKKQLPALKRKYKVVD